MRKGLALGLCLILSLTLVTAIDMDEGISPSTDPSDSSPRLQDDRVQYNPILGWLQTINNNLIEILAVLGGDILTTLEEIADKNTTLTIPEPLDVNVVSEPEQECEWGKLNQRERDVEIGIAGVGCCGFHDYTKTLLLPSDIIYKNVTAVKGRVYAECEPSNNNCYFKINGVGCGDIPSDTIGTYEFSQSCLEALVGGLNNLTMTIPSNCGGWIHDVYLEMQVKPANC